MEPIDFIDRAIQGRRSLEKALADLRAKFERAPTPELERLIRELEAEIEVRGNRQ